MNRDVSRKCLIFQEFSKPGAGAGQCGQHADKIAVCKSGEKCIRKDKVSELRIEKARFKFPSPPWGKMMQENGFPNYYR